MSDIIESTRVNTRILRYTYVVEAPDILYVYAMVILLGLVPYTIKSTTTLAVLSLTHQMVH